MILKVVHRYYYVFVIEVRLVIGALLIGVYDLCGIVWMVCRLG